MLFVSTVDRRLLRGCPRIKICQYPLVFLISFNKAFGKFIGVSTTPAIWESVEYILEFTGIMKLPFVFCALLSWAVLVLCFGHSLNRVDQLGGCCTTRGAKSPSVVFHVLGHYLPC